MDDIKYVEDEIIERLIKGETVNIESGCANDCIYGFTLTQYNERYNKVYVKNLITFKTTACIFPKEVNLRDYENVETEIFEDKLFIHVY